MKRIILFVALILGTQQVMAALFVRDLDGNTVNGHEAVYDDVLDITWLANAGAGSGLLWDQGVDWINTLNSTNYLGVSSWRMPTLSPVNGANFQYQTSYDGSTDWAYHITSPDGVSSDFIENELAYMYYNNLGAVSQRNVDGGVNANYGVDTSVNTDNFNLFTGISNAVYWYGLEYELNTDAAWGMIYYQGNTTVRTKTDLGNRNNVWAVFDGDIASVPEPSTFALFTICLLGIGTLKSRAKTS